MFVIRPPRESSLFYSAVMNVGCSWLTLDDLFLEEETADSTRAKRAGLGCGPFLSEVNSSFLQGWEAGLHSSSVNIFSKHSAVCGSTSKLEKGKIKMFGCPLLVTAAPTKADTMERLTLELPWKVVGWGCSYKPQGCTARAEVHSGNDSASRRPEFEFAGLYRYDNMVKTQHFQNSH